MAPAASSSASSSKTTSTLGAPKRVLVTPAAPGTHVHAAHLPPHASPQAPASPSVSASRAADHAKQSTTPRAALLKALNGSQTSHSPLRGPSPEPKPRSQPLVTPRSMQTSRDSPVHASGRRHSQGHGHSGAPVAVHGGAPAGHGHGGAPAAACPLSDREPAASPRPQLPMSASTRVRHTKVDSGDMGGRQLGQGSADMGHQHGFNYRGSETGASGVAHMAAGVQGPVSTPARQPRPSPLHSPLHSPSPSSLHIHPPSPSSTHGHGGAGGGGSGWHSDSSREVRYAGL